MNTRIITVIAFANAQEERAAKERMKDIVKNFDRWDWQTSLAEILERAKSQFEIGEDWTDYEISKFDTISGSTEIVRFSILDFAITWASA